MLYQITTQLAHENPELRKHLIPLLHKHAAGNDSSSWKAFLEERYDGGKKKVPNPNPDTRKTYPQIALSTALKYPEIREEIVEEYHQWLGKKTEQIEKPFLTPGSFITTDSTFPAYDEEGGEVTVNKGTKLKFYAKHFKSLYYFKDKNNNKLAVPKRYVDHLFAPNPEFNIEPQVKTDFIESKDFNKWGHKWDLDDINRNQRESLRYYTREGYDKINGFLRDNSPNSENWDDDVDNWNAASKIENIDEAFKSPRAKLPTNIKVMRLVSHQHPLAVLFDSRKLTPGYTFEDQGYISTTINQHMSWGNSLTSYRLHISLAKGSKGLYLGPRNYEEEDEFDSAGNDYLLSDNSGEYEVLLPRGTEIRVLSVDWDNKIIHCERI